VRGDEVTPRRGGDLLQDLARDLGRLADGDAVEVARAQLGEGPAFETGAHRRLGQTGVDPRRRGVRRRQPVLHVEGGAAVAHDEEAVGALLLHETGERTEGRHPAGLYGPRQAVSAPSVATAVTSTATPGAPDRRGSARPRTLDAT
jgi:hypothetical protein